jgi:hypothetical protein
MQRRRIEAYIDAVAGALELPIAPEHREGVVRYFELAAQLAAVVATVPLGVADDPAPVFTPIGPDDLPDR